MTSRNDLQNIDRIIHEPARLLILSYLSIVEEADFLFLLKETGLTKGNLSAHLAKLENAGYVEIDKSFVNRTPRTVMKISKTGNKALNRYRNNMETLLNKMK